MIRINANQLELKLKQDPSLRHFCIVGTDPYLLYVSQNSIRDFLRVQGFAEQSVFEINNKTDWELINETSQAMSLFSTQTAIILQFGEQTLTVALAKKLDELTKNLSPDVSLVFMLAKITKTQENGHWFKALADSMAVVSCIAPTMDMLPSWIKQQLKQLELNIENEGINLLGYYYEGNLLALAQALEQLKLLYPSGTVSYAELEKNLNDSAIFTPYHWVDAMLMGKTKRAAHVLQQLKINEFEPVILLRTIQRELIQLINIKKTSQTSNLRVAFDQHKVWQNRRDLYTAYLNKMSLTQLYLALKQLAELEVTLKSDYYAPIWEKIFAFSLVFMGVKND